jgi:hypothetical protein
MYPAWLDCTFTPSSTELVPDEPAGVADVGQMLHGEDGVHPALPSVLPSVVPPSVGTGVVVLNRTSTQ